MKSKIKLQPKSTILDFTMTPLRNVLSKLKVFHQILLLISVLVFFLVLEGFMGLRLLGQMQDMTHSALQTCLSGLQNVLSANQEVDQIRTQLMGTLLTHQPLTIYPNRIENIVHAYPDWTETEKIEEEVKSLTQFSGKQLSTQDYEGINRSLLVIRLSLDA
ncbi:MAG TPA: hypothetical protein DDW50_13290, partial [Firmicutes bacterium]|nr:hypothetical protein [Bacillota bacterium]